MSGGWKGSDRRSTLPPNWSKIVEAVHLRSGMFCEKTRSSGKICGRTADGGVDHIVPHHLGGTDDLENLQDLCRWHHVTKTAAEGNDAKAALRRARQRPAEDHPGRTVGGTDQAAPTRRPREDGS